MIRHLATVAALLLAGCFVFDDPTHEAADGAGGAQGPVEQACRSDSDCFGTERCVVGVASDCLGTDCARPGHCAPPIGATPDLVPCDADADCASGSCAPNDHCRKLCQHRGECPTGYVCEPLATTGGGTIDSCVGDGGGIDQRLCGFAGAPACAAGERCALSYEQNRTPQWSATCVADADDLRVDLEACTANGQCRGGNCTHDGCTEDDGCPVILQVCSSPCASDADCRFPAACQEKDGGLSACKADCLDRRSCPIGQLCAAVPTGAGPRATCLEPRDLLGTGEPCRQDASCTSNLCVPGAAGGPTFCSELCNPADAGSCAANGLQGFTCAVVSAEEPANRSVYACLAP